MAFHNRTTYWSHSKFADKIRDLYKIPHHPTSASWDEWKTVEKKEKEISPFGVKFIEFLDEIQKLVYWPSDTFKDFAYFLSNVSHKSHVLRTRAKFGHWADVTSKIPDALMFAIIDFIEQECFWMNVAFVSNKEQLEKLEPEVRKYVTQSYIMRKFGRVKVSDSVRAKHAREWIDFQIADSPERNAEVYEAIWSAYQFAKTRYFSFDAFEESGYNTMNFEVSFGKISQEKREMYDKMNTLEEQFESEVEKHCTNIIKYRKYLWT